MGEFSSQCIRRKRFDGFVSSKLSQKKKKKILTKCGASKQIRVKITLAMCFPLCQIPNLLILNLIYIFKRSHSTSPTHVNVTECLLV